MLSVIITIVLSLVATVAVYVLYMSNRNGELQKLGFVGPKCKGLMGSSYNPVSECIVNQYNEFKRHKVYAVCGLRQPAIVVASLDVVRDILVKHFSQFPNHRPLGQLKSILNESLFSLEGERWKKVRRIVGTTFSSLRIKRMSQLIEKKTQDLVDDLKEKQESGLEVELKEVCSDFTTDVISNSVFGVDLNSSKDTEHELVKNGKSLLDTFWKGVMFAIFFPFIIPLLNALGFSLGGAKANRFFVDFIRRAVEERKEDEDGVSRDDYLQIVLDLERENSAGTDDIIQELQTPNDKKPMLSQSEREGAATVFFLAGSDTVSTVLSFTLYFLAHHPEVLARAQAEIDQQMAGELPGYDNVQGLTYLEMCLNEAMRIYPPGSVLERHCVETVTVQGITFPKGMRLALVELKIAAAAVLQRVTPVPCDRSVYPIVLEPMRMVAVNGLWVKFEQRKRSTV